MRDRPYTHWGFVLSGLLTLGLLALPVMDPWPEGPPNIIFFFGRFHPLTLHLPIGILVLAFALEICSRAAQLDHLRDAVPFTLALGALTAVIAAGLGWCLSLEGGYNKELLEDHMWLGIATAIASVWTLYARLVTGEGELPGGGLVYGLLLLVTIGLLSLAGHHGGSLTHGKDFLFEYMPAPMRSLMDLSPAESNPPPRESTNDPILFSDLLQPVFQTRCAKCHGPEKTKGDLRMDSYEGILRGGESGPAVVPGNSQKSEIVFRIMLPPDDEDVMPPEGKPRLSPQEIKLITWWVTKGAPPEARLSELDPPDAIRQLIDDLK